MRKFEFNKLIRNKLPDRMVSEGIVINGKSLSREEYSLKLKEKLLEEADEVAKSDSISSITIELADVMEVVYALAENYQIPFELLELERLKKREANGPFDQKTYVNYIEVPKDNKKVIEYLLDKNRHYNSLS